MFLRLLLHIQKHPTVLENLQSLRAAVESMTGDDAENIVTSSCEIIQFNNGHTYSATLYSNIFRISFCFFFFLMEPLYVFMHSNSTVVCFTIEMLARMGMFYC